MLFGLEIVCYLFLGGLGGGLYAIVGAAGLAVPRQLLEHGPLALYRDLMTSAFMLADAVLVLGGLLLLADSGNYPALKYLFFGGSWSYLSIGAWAIVLGVALGFLALLLWRTEQGVRNVRIMRLLHVALVVMGLLIALYTGLFLSDIGAVPLWNTPVLPVLFVLSALSCGLVVFVAMIKAYGASRVFRSYARTLVKVDMAVIVLELLCAMAIALAFVATPADGPTIAAGAYSALRMIAGEYAWVWWGAFLGFGIVATFVFDILILRTDGGSNGRLWSTVASVFCVMAGAFALRFCVIMAGDHPAMVL